MFYEIHQSAWKKRAFSKKKLYKDIDWSDLDQIIDAYRERIEQWYLSPAKELARDCHSAFSVMALNCLLIDTLSQFVAGIPSSKPDQFKDFIRNRLPSIYRRELRTPIERDKHERGPKILANVADVLYHGFRCGILHEAHTPPYCGVAQVKSGVRVVSGLVKYRGSGADCTTVIVDPLKLLKELDKRFESYVRELKNRQSKHNQLRENFKKKFSTSFGIDVTTATWRTPPNLQDGLKRQRPSR
jgi:hypothetical protein